MVGGLVEVPLVLPHLLRVMEENAEYFNSDFTTLDWTTSFFYNFMVWLVCVWAFHLMRPALQGSDAAQPPRTNSGVPPSEPSDAHVGRGG